MPVRARHTRRLNIGMPPKLFDQMVEAADARDATISAFIRDSVRVALSPSRSIDPPGVSAGDD